MGKRESIRVTGNHPFWKKDAGWTESDLLKPGDLVQAKDGGWLRVESLTPRIERATGYNLEVETDHSYFVGNSAAWVHNECNVFDSRNSAFRAAKRDAGIPLRQRPDSVSYENMTDMFANKILSPDGLPILTREYTFTRLDSSRIIIQDHSAGHPLYGEGSHLNIRPFEDARTGRVPGTLSHYYFNK